MQLQDLTIKDFLQKTASNEPVPGGGSISALHGAIASSLAEMLAGLTIGKKKYVEVEDFMKMVASQMAKYQKEFTNDIDRDSDAYNIVFDAFKLPKELDEEKAIRSEKIQEATKIAALVPMEVAERAFNMLSLIVDTTQKGNRNAVTDGCVAAMTCRTAILGALLNVRVNLASLKDEGFVKNLSDKCDRIEAETTTTEAELLKWVKTRI